MGFGHPISGGQQSQRNTRRSARWAVGGSLSRASLVLLALWLAVAVPVACPHGPMSLFEPEISSSPGDHSGHLRVISADNSSRVATPISDPAGSLPLGVENAAHSGHQSRDYAIQPFAEAIVMMLFSPLAGALMDNLISMPQALTFLLLVATAGIVRQLALPPPDEPPRRLQAVPLD